MNNDKKAVACFSATWCIPCKKIKPLYQSFSKKYSNIKFYEIDIDEDEQLVNEMNVKSIPTFVFFENGKKINELVGSDIEKLKEMIEEFNK
jgi:thioredoxin 1